VAIRLYRQGLRANGKFKYGTATKVTNESHGSVGFSARLKEAGVVLDWGGVVEGKMVSGAALADPDQHDPSCRRLSLLA
jgi:hypothetical protein